MSKVWYTPRHYGQPHRIKNVGNDEGGGAPAWAPTDKSGLVFWFKADSLSLSDGDPVSTWTDSSGNLGANATQAGGNRPLYKTNIQNGKPGILFDGTDDYFTLSGAIPTSWNTNAPLSVVIVASLTDKGAGSQFHTILHISTNASNGGANKIPFVTTAIESNATYGDLWCCFPATASTTGVNIAPGAKVGAPVAFYSSYDGAGISTASSYDIRDDNNARAEAATGTGATTNALSLIGAWGGAGATSLYVKGYLFEIFGYNSVLSAGDLTNVAGYIESSDRWAITQA